MLTTSLPTFLHALCRRSARLDSAQLANYGAAVVDIQRLQAHCAGQTMVQVATAAACHKQKLQAHNAEAAEAAEAATIVVTQNKHTHTLSHTHNQTVLLSHSVSALGQVQPTQYQRRRGRREV